jgi:hypothetical protein
MKRTTCSRGFAVAAVLCFGVASVARAEITIIANPTAATIVKSVLVPAAVGLPVTNAAVDAAISGLAPIQVTLKNTGPGASVKVRISPVGAGSHIQLWAKNSDSNWWDINITGWLPVSGYALPEGFDRTIDVYAISDAAGIYPLTVNLAKISDTSVVATTTGTVTVNKATPMVMIMPTATAITYGQALSASTLSGGAASVAGAFAFTAPTTIPNVGTAAQSVTFTPDDATNYETIVFNVNVTVNDLTTLSPPQNLAASDGTDTNKVLLTWNASVGARSYEVWRSTSRSSGSASKISSPDPSGTSYDDTSAAAGTTYYYWVKAGNSITTSAYSASDSGFMGVIGPLIAANGLVGEAPLNSGDPVTIAVQMMNIDPYIGAEVDWWVVVCANGAEWYYLNSSMQWTPFNGDLALCHPVYSGPLVNLSSTTVLDQYLAPIGTYSFWFAIDYPMDGILNPSGQILFDKVTVIVQ